MKKRTREFVAEHEKRRCDGELSSFWHAATLRRDAGGVSFGAPEEPARGTRSAPYGHLFRTGSRHATQDFVCAEHTSVTGDRIVGWLPRSALLEIDGGEDIGHAGVTALAAKLPLTSPPWLVSGDTTRFDDLEVKPLSPSRVSLHLESTSSGHLCSFEGEVPRVAPRMIGDGTGDCELAGLLFDNGVHLWENGDCSGARTTCTGAYLRRP